MRSDSRSARRLVVVALLSLLTPTLAAAQTKPTLTPDEYGKWETLGSFDLDTNGRWLAAAVRRTDESVEVRLRRADGSGEPLILAHATQSAFSPDGRWLGYLEGVSPPEAEKSKTPVHNRLGLVNLSAPHDTVLFEARRFAFRDDGRWLAVQGYAASDSVGADLQVMNPATGATTLFGNVEDFAWQDEGQLLAFTLRTAAGSGSGTALYDPDTGVLRTLDSRDAHYRALTWRDESGQLAVLRSVKQKDREEESHDVLVWDDVQSGRAPRVLAGAGRAELGDSLRVTEHAGVTFDARGRTVFVGLRPWAPAEVKPDSAAAEDDAAEELDPDNDTEVWHWDDDVIFRGQEAGASRRARRTFLAAWHADDHLVVLGDDLDEPVEMAKNGAWGIAPDFTPYHVARRFGDDSADWYRVDPATGERTPLAKGVQDGAQLGPDGTVALVYRDEHWTAVTLASLATKVLGEGTAVEFTRSLEEYDYPGHRPTWGVGAWMVGEGAVLFYDQCDVWRGDLRSGTLTRLTRGAEDGRQYRVVDPGADAPSFFSREPTELDPEKPIWLSVRDVRTKESGYARVSKPGQVETLVFQAAQVGGLRKAEDADRYALRAERWDDSPDVFVGSGKLNDLVQVTHTNPFQGDYAWGHSELVSYTTDAGHDLQGILVYPANYEAGTKYPLILYQYERLSDNLHAYRTPSERSYYNFQVWSQQGYFVLMPDIVYEPGRPGPSALDAVEHALDAAIATGHVDADHMGLIGHSWGGYQAAYLPTRTNRFAASVAGAAITDFISFPGTIHWNGGFEEFGHWETGQARMALPPWDDLQGHLESSPVNFINDLQTPVMLMHGDADGTVDFRQGQEYYNYARRAGKRVLMLVYPGADHGLRKKEQQIDYHHRILQWFGHWLKDQPAPAWITKGETFEERDVRSNR